MRACQVGTQSCGKRIPRGSRGPGYFRGIRRGYHGEEVAWGPRVEALTCSCDSRPRWQGWGAWIFAPPAPTPGPHCVWFLPPGNRTGCPLAPPPPSCPGWSQVLAGVLLTGPQTGPDWAADPNAKRWPYLSPGFNTPTPEIDEFVDKKRL